MHRLPALVLAGLLGLTGALVALRASTEPTARAAVVNTAACRADNPTLHRGVCHRFPDGRVTWLGTLVNPRGKVFFCIDKSLDSRLPATAPTVSTRGLRNQFGRRIGAAEISALNHLISTWGPRATRTDAAAISLIIRQVMGDTRGQFPSGLTVHRAVRPIAGGLPRAILARARSLWSQSAAQRGPWRVELGGSTAALTVGATRVVTVDVRSAANQRVATPVVVAVTGSAPARIMSSRSRSVTVALRASRAGVLTVTGSATGPAPDGRLFDPSRRRVQRGWIAAAATARAALQLRAVVTKWTPRVSTRISHQEALVGSTIHDSVQVSGLAGKPVTTPVRISWSLLGPLAPAGGSCAALDWSRAPTAATGELRVRSDGRYRTPSHRVLAAGCHTYTERVIGTARVSEYLHPPGLVSQTMMARHQPTLATRTSVQRVAVGARLVDRVTVGGLAPGVRADVGWQLLGPRPALHGGCTGLTWAGAPVHDSGRIRIDGNGTWTTSAARAITTVGCYTYTETMAATDLTLAAVHPPGHVDQTTLAFRYTPAVRTRVSRQVARVGQRLRDRVLVTGLRPGTRAPVAWQLLGPMKPVGHTCARGRWSTAPIHDRGVLSAGNGWHRTPAAKPLRRVGCYTYTERLASTPDTVGVWHAPGKRSQTTRVKPPRTPRVPTGW